MSIRIGIIGAGDNTRKRHIPGLQAIAGVEIVGVCNRRQESTTAVATEYGIPKTYSHWEEVVADPDIDAIVIGTWPYLHCPITLAALKAGKHVLCEARMSMTAAEAHRMLEASRKHPELVTQIVPSPFGLKGNKYMQQLIQEGFLGDLREVHVFSRNATLADPASSLSWRQDVSLSGINMLTLGIVHETLLRWIPAPVFVQAQVHAFIPHRIDPASGVTRQVGTPDSVQVLAELPNNARVTYHFSGATPYGQGMGIHLYGTTGALHYDLAHDRIFGASATKGHQPGSIHNFEELPISQELVQDWEVEADFIKAIRKEKTIELTSFEKGVTYMEFTEAVARSAEREEGVELPLPDFVRG